MNILDLILKFIDEHEDIDFSYESRILYLTFNKFPISFPICIVHFDSSSLYEYDITEETITTAALCTTSLDTALWKALNNTTHKEIIMKNIDISESTLNSYYIKLKNFIKNIKQRIIIKQLENI